MSERRLRVKNQKLKETLKNNSRNDAKKDFFELLKRAAKPLKN